MTILSQFYSMQSSSTNITLIIPNKKHQILVNDNAHYISLQSFMHFNGIKFSIKQKENVEQMSLSGNVPLLFDIGHCVAGFIPCLNFIKAKIINEPFLKPEPEDIKVYLVYIDNVFTLSSLYMLWKNETIFQNFTSKRYGFPYPFPINFILSRLKRREILREISSNGWHKYHNKQVIEEINKCCQAISNKMGTKTYILGERPCEVDALLYGYYYAILTSSPPTLLNPTGNHLKPDASTLKMDIFSTSTNNGFLKTHENSSPCLEDESIDIDDISLAIRSTLLKYEKLLDLCYRIDKIYFCPKDVNTQEHSHLNVRSNIMSNDC